MCGIAGAFDPDRDDETLESSVAAALGYLAHRGPDARAARSFGRAVLGAVRLRIIDLSPTSDQPLANEDGTVWVAYNGELYNAAEIKADLEAAGHVFRTRCDTECLVHLYEELGDSPQRMLNRLRGMFSFAVWDVGRQRLLLARDRLGIKPLYWSRRGGGIAFASEVRALARSGLAGSDPDLRAIRGYLTWGVVPGPDSIIQGIQSLPPGHFLELDRRRLHVAQWWEPRPQPDDSLADSREAVRVLASTLSDAAARHLVSDRPVGLFLSGGTDSAAVAAVAARHGPLRGLTVAFPDSSDLDESPAATRLASRLGVPLELVDVRGVDAAEGFPDALSDMDQPTTDGFNTWLVSRAARRAGFVVALSGLGGDELFGGYPSFDLVPRVARLRGVLGLLPWDVRARAALHLARRRPGGKIGRVLTAGPGLSGAYGALRGLFSAVEIEALDLPDTRAVREPADSPTGVVSDRLLVLEAHHYLANQLLPDTDALSMAHSLEVRVPLLDDLMVSVALAIPAETRVTRGKSLLGRAAGLGQIMVKRPFTLPLHTWMQGPLSEVVHEGLCSQSLPFARLIDRRWRLSLWDSWQAGRVHWSRPWSVALLRLWPTANGFHWS